MCRISSLDVSYHICSIEHHELGLAACLVLAFLPYKTADRMQFVADLN
jgi:hypothetical protein